MIMATGTVTAREPQGDPKTETQIETTESGVAQPLTLIQRFHRLLTHIFEGREEHLGWRQ
jgi:hypothetical protein